VGMVALAKGVTIGCDNAIPVLVTVPELVKVPPAVPTVDPVCDAVARFSKVPPKIDSVALPVDSCVPTKLLVVFVKAKVDAFPPAPSVMLFPIAPPAAAFPEVKVVPAGDVIVAEPPVRSTKVRLPTAESFLTLFFVLRSFDPADEEFAVLNVATVALEPLKALPIPEAIVGRNLDLVLSTP